MKNKTIGVREGRVHECACRCRKLAVRIIEDALDDIKKKRRSRYYRWSWRRAYNWVMSEDFDWWCSIAGYDASYLRDRIKQIAEKKK